MNSFWLQLRQPLSLSRLLYPPSLLSPLSLQHFTVITVLWCFRGMETGIEADNIPQCECLCILSNFLNVLQRDVPESEIPEPSLSLEILVHTDTLT